MIDVQGKICCYAGALFGNKFVNARPAKILNVFNLLVIRPATGDSLTVLWPTTGDLLPVSLVRDKRLLPGFLAPLA